MYTERMKQLARAIEEAKFDLAAELENNYPIGSRVFVITRAGQKKQSPAIVRNHRGTSKGGLSIVELESGRRLEVPPWRITHAEEVR